MYLKALELQGFKSFPDKTRILFEKPITAVVGPNGSGKSNISDAILWVMGEQSTKALRGGKMEDVIFGGTEKRGQMGFAEVSLIFDNSEKLFDMDESEIMLTRRYYRSGDSEYYINRQSVRLRDISELLMDTGMGRDGYSIIGQGKIDSVLSAKSTDRREIFEEAAGISRFRHRKEESERKLGYTEDNLLRVNDKIAELEMQIEPLEKQAGVAKRYLILRDELRDLEISLWTDSLEKLAVQAKKLEISRTGASERLKQSNEELEEIYAGSEAHAEKMRQKDVEADAVRELVSEAEAAAAAASSDAAVLRANLENTLSEAERIQGELTTQQAREGGIKAQIDERLARIEEIASEKSALHEDLTQKQAELEALAKAYDEAAKGLAALVKEENEAVTGALETKAELSALAAKAQEMEDRDGAIASELIAAGDKLNEIGAGNEKCALELKKAEDEAVSLRNIISGHELRASGRRKKLAAAFDEKNNSAMQCEALRSRISLLTEMEKEYRGYSNAVKTVMQEAQRGTLRNICGTVAGLVETQDKYAAAVETALGGAMQDIIVESEADGKAALNMLKRRDAGRMTFQPISTVRGSRLAERGLDGEEGFLGLAIDLVKYDAKYDGIYLRLLGRIAITETLDDAIRISRKYGARFRIVSLDGQVMNTGGSMTGGSSPKNAGIISRDNELKALKAREKAVKDDYERLCRDYEALKRETDAAEYELETAKSELREFEDTVLKLRADSGHYAQLISAAEESITAMRRESEALRNSIEDNDRAVAEKRAEIEALERCAAHLREQIEEKSGEDFTQLREALSAEISEMRAKDASLDAQRYELDSSVRELSAISRDISEGKLHQQDASRQLLERKEEILRLIAEKDKEIKADNEKVEEYKSKISQLSEEKLKIEAERVKRDRELQDKNKEILDLERECASLEQKALAADMEEKQLVDKLWDTYELSRTDAFERRTQLQDIAASASRTAEVKREISKLGTPNLGAIEEYERVSTRYNFLAEQRDDVVKAKNELTAIIKDITDEMRAIFSREFELINSSFKQTFAELFGGGRCELILEDEEDILNCGIEIKVQPPGKTLKTLTLLSGGEKAFVAIALYFAIIKVRPTPFIVMDEIEAALDEVNVSRFAGYMRGLSDKTQMIVITHRRGTMEEADVLYGVTMQEKGVSKVLSVDLDEAEKTIDK